MKSTKEAETKILRTHREGLFVRGGGSHTAATPHVLLSEELRHTARWPKTKTTVHRAAGLGRPSSRVLLKQKTNTKTGTKTKTKTRAKTVGYI